MNQNPSVNAVRYANDQAAAGTGAEVAAMGNIGQTILSLGQQYQEQRRFQQQMQLQQSELEMRSQVWQSERALNAQKLQEMMAVDMAKRSRLENEVMEQQLNSMKAQNAMQSYDLERRKQMDSQVSPGMRALADIANELNSVLANPSSGAEMVDGEIKFHRQGTPEYEALRQQRIEALQESRPTSSAHSSASTLSRMIRDEMSSLTAQRKQLAFKDDSESKKQIVEIDRQLEALRQESAGLKNQLRTGASAAVQQMSEDEMSRDQIQKSTDSLLRVALELLRVRGR